MLVKVFQAVVCTVCRAVCDIEKNLCVKLDNYQESLHDARSTKRSIPQLVSEILLTIIRTERDTTINVRRSSCKIPVILGQIL